MKYDFRRGTWLLAGLATVLTAQQPQRTVAKKPFHAQSASTITYNVKDGQDVIEIANSAYELTGSGIPGRSRDERLVLRETSRMRQVVDEIGIVASTTIEAWPLGVPPEQKPLYAITVAGVEPKTVNNDLIVISRGLEEVAWWSVYRLGTGARLFDTYVPLLHFSIGTEVQELRYVGLEVPPDDVGDARLRAPNVIAVVTYASATRVIREALITCDNRELARLLRSYADTTRKTEVVQKRITISMNLSNPAAKYSVGFPVANDDLDFAHVTLPPGLHIAAWKR